MGCKETFFFSYDIDTVDVELVLSSHFEVTALELTLAST